VQSSSHTIVLVAGIDGRTITERLLRRIHFALERGSPEEHVAIPARFARVVTAVVMWTTASRDKITVFVFGTAAAVPSMTQAEHKRGSYNNAFLHPGTTRKPTDACIVLTRVCRFTANSQHDEAK
jgi:hypothetical protein